MVRDDILGFLREPRTFADGVSAADAARWQAGLTEFAQPSIANHKDHPLRDAQVTAWNGIATKRAALVLGPPGTGKTFALSWMALGYLESCRQAGVPCRILVTGFTRNAIGNLLEAIGERAAIHSPVPPRICFLGDNPPEGLADSVDRLTLKEAHEVLDETPYAVVGTTSWSLYKALRKGNYPGADGPTAAIFNLVCIDEASQIVVSQGLMCLGGLAPGGRVLVAGDNRQLPPVRAVHDRKVQGRKLGASLYDFLYDAGIAEFRLEETFRLNVPLTEFPSERFYEGQFYSVEDARKRRLVLRDEWEAGLEPWERAALDPDHPVCILVHQGPPAGTSNPFEAHMAVRLAKKLKERIRPEASTAEEFWQKQLAIVSPHRAQNALIRDGLAGQGLGDACVVETVDRIQGRERDAVIASYTVADAEFALAEAAFIYSAERFNVTVTRARTKLILLVSRQLFEAVPADQGVFDAAQALREFVFASTFVGDIHLPGPDGTQYPAAVRVRSFENSPLPDLSAPTVAAPAEPLPELDDHAFALLDLIQRLAGQSQWGTVEDYTLAKEMLCDVSLPQLRPLMLHGHVTLDERFRKRDNSRFWVVKPREHVRQPFSVDEPTVRQRIEQALEEARRGRGAPLYARVRDRFAWVDADGNDILRPVVQRMVDEGLLAWGQTANQAQTLERAEVASPSIPEAVPAENLSERDFVVLNRLEELEARRLNFGVFERWTLTSELVRALGEEVPEGTPAVADAIRRLAAHGFLLVAEDGRLRSRMAELAREVRYVKQRFSQGDAHKRPYLVRGLKLELKNRDKPNRDQPLASIEAELSELLAQAPNGPRVAKGLCDMLRIAWKTPEPELAGFQRRALTTLLAAWTQISDVDACVITADTGSGKTEAACLPLIAGAALDRLHGVQGTRAILVYPRIQLGANQAQRLAGYLAALQQVDGMPVVTLGLQNGQVPTSFHGEVQPAELWQRTPAGHFTFPFFRCPACDAEIQLAPGCGFEGADRLQCQICTWHFDGWVGSKMGLTANPPALFLPVTESLHQWLQNPRYAPLFGDRTFAPPRAVLADEIHLYSHIHGAQIGYMLRRLLERSTLEGVCPLAIGMSATLGRPADVWGDLTGRAEVVEIAPRAEERMNNPRGREYFYFVQPEVESRGSDIAGASTTIQTIMALAHGMRRRDGRRGGYRGLVFLDSIDKVKRLHTDYTDAEEGRRLAQFRTRMYDDDPLTGQPQRSCCGQPESCATFSSGECWYFAANDQAQRTVRGIYRPGDSLRVSSRPVFSGTGGKVDALIKGSDIVFATSSLEVGYDDPEMTLVYQHYAPVNLASFIQRKGRGGRGSDDRPITGVTLSVYSPRDAWYFRFPKQMLDAAHFEVPLNMANYFVRRGQAVAVLLDVLARQVAAAGGPPFPVSANVLAMAGTSVERIFGAGVWKDLGVTDMAALWAGASAGITAELATTDLKDWRTRLPWVPTLLFDTINLPALNVAYPDEQQNLREQSEDIALAFASCAPGNMTRRYSFNSVHWVMPGQRHAPLMVPQAYATAPRIALPGGADDLLSGLPLEARRELQDKVAPEIVRPERLELSAGGRMDGAVWVPFWAFDAANHRLVPADAGEALPKVGHKSRGHMRGFLLVNVDRNKAQARTVHALEGLASGCEAFVGQPGTEQVTGLSAYRVFWGSDAELVLDDHGRRGEATMRQTFVSPEDPQLPVLHGYALESEGVRLHLDSRELDRFVSDEAVAVASTPEGQHLKTQFRRYLLESRLVADGWNVFQARQLSEVVVTALAFPDSERRVRALLRRWDPSRFVDILLEVFRQRLAQHPALSERRIARLKDALDVAFADRLEAVLQEADDPKAFRSYLRSLVIHGIGLRFQQAFVLHGRGDERRVLLHARLPLQFGDGADDVVTVLENGEHGDGTTRTFLMHLDQAFETWRHGGLAACPNAEEDAVLERLFEDEKRLEAWRQLEPSEPETLERLAADLGIDLTTQPGAMQAVLRLLFGEEEIGAERFEWMALHREVQQVRQSLEAEIGREPQTWELVSAVTSAAESSLDSVPNWSRLRHAYAGLDDASLEESLSPAARLADQVHRLSARLCHDGCQACLHTGSTLMHDSLAQAAVSRRVLSRFAQGVFRLSTG